MAERKCERHGKSCSLKLLTTRNMKGNLKVSKSVQKFYLHLFPAIMKKTGQSYETVRRQFDEFHSICPEGVMTRRKFLDLSKSALGEQSEFMAENLFRF